MDYRGRAVKPRPSVVSAEEVASGAEVQGALEQLAFPDPSWFIAGGIHAKNGEWQTVVETQREKGGQVMEWIQEGVDITKFLTRFKGSFRGKHFDSDVPPKMYFANAAGCRPFIQLIEKTISERLCNGSIRVWGEVSVTDPPKVVMPLVVGPSKPRVFRCTVCESVDTGPAVYVRYVETSANNDTEGRIYDIDG